MVDELSNQFENVIPEIDELEAILRTYRPEPAENLFDKMANASWMKPINAVPAGKRWYQKFTPLKTHPYRYAVGFLSLLLLLVVLLSTTSIGQSLAQTVTQFFRIAESDQKIETVSITPFPTPDPGYPYNQYPLDVSEAENLAGFAVKVPENIPEVWIFRGAKYDPENQQVSFLYTYPSPDGDTASESGYMYIDQLQGEFEKDWELCPQDIVEATTVNGWPAEIVSGGVWMTITEPTPGVEREWVWEKTGEIGSGGDPITLRWEEDEMKFQISVMQFSTDNMIQLTKQDLVDLAESMK